MVMHQKIDSNGPFQYLFRVLSLFDMHVTIESELACTLL